jgi:hypothetical protein
MNPLIISGPSLLIRRIDCVECSIGLFYSYFIYALSYSDNKFKIYNLLNNEKFDDILNDLAIEHDYWRCLTFFNQKLVITLSKELTKGQIK